jgi:tetratricopeptide (TPR) repeat protein
MGIRELRLVAPIALLAILCIAAALVVWRWSARGTDPRRSATAEPASEAASEAALSGDQAARKTAAIHMPQSPLVLVVDGGLGLASVFTDSVDDHKSLPQLGAAIQSRGGRGLAVLQKQLDQRDAGSKLRGKQVLDPCQLHLKIGTLLVHEGRLNEAADSFQKALNASQSTRMPAAWRSELAAVLGIVALRRGEVDNCIACVGPSSCIFPIAPEAVHSHTAGSRDAIAHFTSYLQEFPDELRIRWLLNLAYMTLGEYPAKVPPNYFIPLDTFQSGMEIGRFENVAPLVGLISRGPNLAGGSVFDDFTGDGLPDLFITSLDADRGASLLVNRGDGTFEDRSHAAGLDDQMYALNAARADYDNDGDLDVLLLRGGWEAPMRLSLLRNDGHGRFEDVTLASGLSEPIATESAAWGDYDNDGLIDVFVCGEYLSPEGEEGGMTAPQPCNRCRLYRNRGDDTFVDVAASAGVVNEGCAKGSAWGDYDGDGWLDLFVSNMGGPCRLYHNEGNGTFRDVAPELGVKAPERGFACWFWDYDNDGRLDLYINDYSIYLEDFVAIALGRPPSRPSRPRLYRNLGAAGFRDVTVEVGLDRAVMPMGCNFGDIDNDGYLDVYLGTGRMSFASLVPNLMLKNVGGRRFEDVTISSGTGHLQKGHGISFADWDCDGDLDLFVEAGGGVPGDKAYNLLFQNPCQGCHWLKVKLVGTKTNRAALGASIKALVKGSDGAVRSIYRTVGNNSSFGGNSLVELIGLSEATSVAELTVSWPTSRTTQTFRNIAADQMIVITEGADSFTPLPQPRLLIPRHEKPVSTFKGY